MFFFNFSNLLSTWTLSLHRDRWKLNRISLSVRLDILIKSVAKYSPKMPKSSISSFTWTVPFWQQPQKSAKYFGYFVSRSDSKIFKNGPIWSLWSLWPIYVFAFVLNLNFMRLFLMAKLLTFKLKILRFFPPKLSLKISLFAFQSLLIIYA